MAASELPEQAGLAFGVGFTVECLNGHPQRLGELEVGGLGELPAVNPVAELTFVRRSRFVNGNPTRQKGDYRFRRRSW
ncbi:MAG TPA: hypothetical protein VM938_13475 [Acidimicrobiales bacterium]|nr:hypothetical protein [Acidimicrobiales bacterium]